MTVKEIVRAAMMCAVYGVLAVLNTQMGSLADGLMPVLFGLPILVSLMINKGKGLAASLMAMIMITLMLTPPTSWLYELAALFTGSVYGWGLERRKSLGFCFVTGFVLCAISEFAAMLLFYTVAGLQDMLMDPVTQIFASQISLYTIAICYAILNGLLQSFCLLCISQLMARRWFKKQNLPGFFPKPVKPLFFAFSLLGLLIILLCFGNFYWQNELFQWSLSALLFLNYLIVDYNGLWLFILKRKKPLPFWLMFVLILVWLIPPFNLVYVIKGTAEPICRKFAARNKS